MTAMERKAKLDVMMERMAREKSEMWEALIKKAIEDAKAAGLPVDEDGRG